MGTLPVVMKLGYFMIALREISDIEELMHWRIEVIRHVFDENPDDALIKANREYYANAVPCGMHHALVASCDDEECGCGGVCLSSELPSPDNPSGRCAYLMNIYVREKFRNNGIAHHIVSKLIDIAKGLGCEKIYLETTAEGKPVYESLGFRDMPDMMKYYDTKN